jgi:hypothetical protein
MPRPGWCGRAQLWRRENSTVKIALVYLSELADYDLA